MMAESYLKLRQSVPAEFISSRVFLGCLRPDASLFTKFITGTVTPPYRPITVMAPPSFLDDKEREYVIFGNKPENDANWNNPEFAGHASMSQNHKFLLPTNLTDGMFALNAATIPANKRSLQKLQDMKDLATSYATLSWNIKEDQVGLYFHCYPDSSIAHLHLHIVDLSRPGFMLDRLADRNLSIDVVMDVIASSLNQ
jgi:hypothetical protein